MVRSGSYEAKSDKGFSSFDEKESDCYEKSVKERDAHGELYVKKFNIENLIYRVNRLVLKR